MTWQEVTTNPRHGLGSELIEVGQIKPALPPGFAGAEKVLVLRYDGMLPMAVSGW